MIASWNRFSSFFCSSLSIVALTESWRCRSNVLNTSSTEGPRIDNTNHYYIHYRQLYTHEQQGIRTIKLLALYIYIYIYILTGCQSNAELPQKLTETYYR